MKAPALDRSYYEILELNRDVTILDIEAAWQRKQHEYDPGKLRGLTQVNFGVWGINCRNLQRRKQNELRAYEVLRDPAKRKEYDRMLTGTTVKHPKSTQAIQLENFMSKQAEIANDRAIEYWKQKRFEEAIAQWEGAARNSPNIAEIHNNLGNAYAHQGKIENAIESLKQAISIDPTLLEAYNKLGVIYYKQGNLNLAYASWNLALKVDPNFEKALHNIKLIQNATQFDVGTDVPPYQHVTSEGVGQDGSTGIEGDTSNKPSWKDRVQQSLRKLKKQ
jgi:tetratricopeptide (TPR) repeat protein